MYNGQVEVPQDNIDEFLKAAGELRVKGLSKDMRDREDTDEVTASDAIFRHSTTPTEMPKEVNVEEKTYKEIDEISEFEIKEEFDGFDRFDRFDKFQVIISNMMIKYKDIWKCKECGKTMTNQNNMKRHIETHVEGISFRCPLCQKTCKSSNSLNVNVHKSKKRCKIESED